MKLCLDKRGELINQEYVSGNRVELHFMLPLGEIVIDFYDKLKSISKGYASFDYHIDSFRHSDLVKLDILLEWRACGCAEHFDPSRQRRELRTQDVREVEGPDTASAV